MLKKNPKGETVLHLSVCEEEGLKYCKGIIEKFDKKNENQQQNLTVLINKTRKDGLSALHLAAKHNHPEVVEYLLGNGAKANIKSTNKLGYSPLHYAAIGGYEDCIIKLLENEKDDEAQRALLNQKSNDGETAMVLATLENEPRACELLAKTDISLQAKKHNTALTYAMYRGYYKVIETILENSDVSVLTKESVNYLQTLASETVNEHILPYFLEKYPVKDVTNNEKLIKCMLERATKRNRESNLRFMLQDNTFKSHIDKKLTNGDTMLHIALRKSNYKIALLLLNNKASINVCNDNEEYPLHLLASGDPKAALTAEFDKVSKKVLSGSKEYITTPNKSRQTPLFLATTKNNPHILKQLLNAKPKIFKKTDKDTRLSPIHFAAQYGYYDCLSVMLKNLSSVDKQVEHLRNMQPHPLFLAAEKGHLKICQLLIKKLKVSNTGFICIHFLFDFSKN